MNVQLDTLIRLLREHGAAAYHGEEVTQLQHALQCAHLAENANAQPALVAAALLHDIGHLAHHLGEDAAVRGIDDRHEHRGAGLVQRVFPNSVSEPVRLHVQAKRCLCAIDSGYLEKLSPASLLSLQLQGGVMSSTEVLSFMARPYANDALQLRRWDDNAKDPRADPPTLDHYVVLLRNWLECQPQ